MCHFWNPEAKSRGKRVEKTVGKQRTIETIHQLMEYLTKDKDDIIPSLLVSDTNVLLHN
jgi:hypothetical protein